MSPPLATAAPVAESIPDATSVPFESAVTPPITLGFTFLPMMTMTLWLPK